MRKESDKKPKGRKTAYSFFLKEERQKQPKPSENEAKTSSSPSVAYKEFAKECSARWKSLNEDERKPFEELSKADKIRYDQEMEVYKTTEEYQIEMKRKQEEKQKRATLKLLKSGTSNGSAAEAAKITNISFCNNEQSTTNNPKTQESGETSKEANENINKNLASDQSVGNSENSDKKPLDPSEKPTTQGSSEPNLLENNPNTTTTISQDVKTMDENVEKSQRLEIGTSDPKPQKENIPPGGVRKRRGGARSLAFQLFCEDHKTTCAKEGTEAKSNEDLVAMWKSPSNNEIRNKFNRLASAERRNRKRLQEKTDAGDASVAKIAKLDSDLETKSQSKGSQETVTNQSLSNSEQSSENGKSDNMMTEENLPTSQAIEAEAIFDDGTMKSSIEEHQSIVASEGNPDNFSHSLKIHETVDEKDIASQTERTENCQDKLLHSKTTELNLSPGDKSEQVDKENLKLSQPDDEERDEISSGKVVGWSIEEHPMEIAVENKLEILRGSTKKLQVFDKSAAALKERVIYTCKSDGEIFMESKTMSWTNDNEPKDILVAKDRDLELENELQVGN